MPGVMQALQGPDGLGGAPASGAATVLARVMEAALVLLQPLAQAEIGNHQLVEWRRLLCVG